MDAIEDYLNFGFQDHTDETFFEGINQLEPGHCLVWRDGNLFVRRYWNLLADPSGEMSDLALVEEFRSLFEDSVRMRLNSDVPIGSCLSGGLDSSAIIAVASGILRKAGAGPMQTFTVDYSSFGLTELHYARAAAEMVGARMHVIEPGTEDLLEWGRKAVWYQDEPFAALGVKSQWHAMQLAGSQGATVLLDGQGADEYLGGYIHFVPFALADSIRAGKLREFLRDLGAYARNQGLPISAALSETARRLASPKIPNWARSGRPSPPKAQKQPSHNLLTRQTQTALELYNLRAYLHYEDRNSMAFSREARLPFLDHRLVQFVHRLPNRLKIRGGVTKWILRQSIEGQIPAAILDRHEKLGYPTPFRELIERNRRGIADLLAACPPSRPWMRAPQVRGIIERFRAGDNSSAIWQVVALELWTQEFLD